MYIYVYNDKMFSGMRFTVFAPLEVPTKMSSSTLRKSINFLNRLKSKRNSVFATNFYFLITMSLEYNLADLRYFKL